MRRRQLLGALSVAGASALAGCGIDGSTPQGQTATNSLTLTSPTVPTGGRIPESATCEGANASPPFTIGDVPQAAETLALLIDDLDASEGSFTHWVVWNLPPTLTSIPSGVPRGPSPAVLEGGVQGLNGLGDHGYVGPCLSEADGEHTYRFQVFALSDSLDLGEDQSGPALLNAIDPVLVAVGGFTARYGRAYNEARRI